MRRRVVRGVMRGVAVTAAAMAIGFARVHAETPPPAPLLSIAEHVEVVERSGGTLTVKTPGAAFSRAIAVPSDDAPLARCIEGGTPVDLDATAIVSLRYDPKGTVLPRITIEAKPRGVDLHGVNVVDRGPETVYVVMPDGMTRAFRTAGAPLGYGVRAGAVVDLHFDPTGRTPMTVTAPVASASRGCRATSPRAPCPMRGAWLLASVLAVVAGVRRRPRRPRRR